MRAHTTLRLYQRVIRRGTLADELSECKDKIEFSLRKFMVCMMQPKVKIQIEPSFTLDELCHKHANTTTKTRE